MSALRASALSVRLGRSTVLTDVDVEVARGEWLALIGPNGAGKSTLLRALVGLVPSDGDVSIEGDGLRSLPRRERARRVALVPQNPVVPPDMTVWRYVLLGRTPHLSYLGRERPVDVEAAEGALSRLDLERFAGRALGTLSGGELQRAVLARAIAQDASILLLDEPTSALDIGHQQHVLDLVDGLRRERELTVVTAIHDLTLAGLYADRLVLLDCGRVVATGTPRQVLSEPVLLERYGARVRVLADGRGVAVVPWREDAERE